jgi:F-type H+-transporting ATPase subunit epsilon
MSELNVEIVTPYGVVYTGDIKACTAPGADGLFQILNEHADFLSNLEIGEIKVEGSDGVKLLATSGGFLEVKDNIISIVVETAEFASEIDIERAKSAEQRARMRLESKEEVDFLRAEMALARALNRLKIASQI